ncbi:MAG: DNA mismatch repair endonuclease MutL [Promethearchaeota archaeon]
MIDRIHEIRNSEKIAAGEVVERPASVVKELVENSIDAGANSITVNVENFGRDLVEVIDDGRGIHPDDVELAFKKHTSSKIEDFSDLDELSTLGFRGEALASVGLVSKVTLTSRVADVEHAVLVRVEDGRVREKRQVARPVGTTVAVRDLFYNVPARRKFLKSDRVELAHVSDVVTRYALARPDIHFRYFHDGAMLLNSPPTGDLRQAVAHCHGVKAAREMVEVDYSDDDAGIRITGLAGRPTLTRGSRDDSSTFVNGRFIKSKEISNAVLRAYGNSLMKRRYPLVVLFIEVSPRDVDVNVHPAKRHVRFSNVQRIFNGVLLAVSRALRGAGAIPGEVYGSGAGVGVTGPKASGVTVDSGGAGEHATVRNWGAATGEQGGANDRGGGAGSADGRNTDLFEGLPGSPRVLDSGEQERAPRTVQVKLGGGKAGGTGATAIPREVYVRAANELLPPLRPINEVGQLFNTYLLLESPDSLYILDQHAASERVNYERILRRKRGKPLPKQRLLAPLKLDLTLRETDFLKETIPEFARYGFEIEHFGGQTFLVRQVPVIFGRPTSPETLRATINDLIELSSRTTFEDAEDELAKYMACHSSIRAGDPLSLRQVRKLLSDLGKCEDPFHCCHGRPTIIKISTAELETRFKRRV